jgi:hypothetical protein
MPETKSNLARTHLEDALDQSQAARDRITDMIRKSEESLRAAKAILEILNEEIRRMA